MHGHTNIKFVLPISLGDKLNFKCQNSVFYFPALLANNSWTQVPDEYFFLHKDADHVN